MKRSRKGTDGISFILNVSSFYFYLRINEHRRIFIVSVDANTTLWALIVHIIKQRVLSEFIKGLSLGQNPRFYLGFPYDQRGFETMEKRQLKNLPLNKYIETEPTVRTVRPLNHQQQIGQVGLHSKSDRLCLIVDRTGSKVKKYVNSQKLEAYRNHWKLDHWKLDHGHFVGREGT